MSFEQAALAEEQLSQAFSPSEARIYTEQSLRTDPHYALVINCNEQLESKITQQRHKLAAQDASLEFTPPEGYHVTVFLASTAIDPQRMKQAMQTLLAGSRLVLTVQGLHIRPMGIVANAYASSDGLGTLRDQLAQEFGPQFIAVPDRLRNVGWITLARFTAPPTQSVVSYVLAHTREPLGTLSTNDLHLYQAAHRQHLNATKIW
jgi:hypothetical protein